MFPRHRRQARSLKFYLVVVDDADDIVADLVVPYTVFYLVLCQDGLDFIDDWSPHRPDVLDVPARYLYLCLNGNEALLNVKQPDMHLPRFGQFLGKAAAQLLWFFVYQFHEPEPF